jgi:ABC-type dipeptide/oligopeptide/nickel transport system ATPase component
MVENLTTAFDTEGGQVRAVDDVGFVLRKGRNLGIVGESGCGKSVTALSIMRLLPKPAGKILTGRIVFKGTDIVALPAGDMHAVRGNQIAMIFQEPMTALNPVHTIGRQVGDIFHLHFPAMSDEDVLLLQ